MYPLLIWVIFQLWSATISAREKLIDNIADIDNDVAEKIINDEGTGGLSNGELVKAVRKSTINRVRCITHPQRNMGKHITLQRGGTFSSGFPTFSLF